MKESQLTELFQVASVLYQREYDKVRAIIEDEARVRGALARIDQQETAARQSINPNDGIQIVGADVLWQSWVSRSRRDLNLELAQIRARKLNVMDQVRKAFGRKEAISELLGKSRLARQRQQQSNLLTAAMQIPGKYGR